MKIIISGAISNDENFMEKFIDKERELKKQYPEAEIFNPALYCDKLIKSGVIKLNQSDDDIWLDCMAWVFPQFKGATHIYFIHGTITSVGKQVEKLVSKKLQLKRIEI